MEQSKSICSECGGVIAHENTCSRNPNSPIAALRREMQAQIDDLKAQLAELAQRVDMHMDDHEMRDRIESEGNY